MNSTLAEIFDFGAQIESAFPDTITLFITGLVTIFMFYTYKQVHSTISYNKNFNITLVLVSLITMSLFSAIESNINISLGMLGALSIVRFRTNIKDIRDVVFIFWSLAIGIICSTGEFIMAFIVSIVISGVMIMGGKNHKGKAHLIVVRGSNADLTNIEEIIATHYTEVTVKAKNLLADSFELVYEVYGEKIKANPINDAMFAVEGVDSMNILAPNTEVS